MRARVTYEGQAAAELEGVADPAERDAYEIAVGGGAGAPLVLDPRAGDQLARFRTSTPGVRLATVAARFHAGLSEGVAQAVIQACRERGLDLVVLSGGVFQNRLLAERTLAALGRAGLRTLIPAILPPNDGGIAYGQVAVAAAIAARESQEEVE